MAAPNQITRLFIRRNAMSNITIDENGLLVGKVESVASVKPDGDSSESKTVTLVIDFTGMSIAELIQPAVKSIRIAWQATARKHFTEFKNADRIAVDAQKPGAWPETTASLLSKMKKQGLTKEDLLRLAAEME
jgi:hypothetical protein